MTSPWLRNDPAPHYASMTLGELLALWSSNRNSIVAVMAAEEVMRRLAGGKL